MAIMKASKLQLRVLSLANQECDGTYDHASKILTAMGLPANGAPKGYTARQAGKLSDQELLSLLPEFKDPTEELRKQEVEEQREKELRRQFLEEKEKMFKERERVNKALKKAGYRWVKIDENYESEIEALAPYIENNDWCLFTPDNKPIKLSTAKAQLGL